MSGSTQGETNETIPAANAAANAPGPNWIIA
jgi:hypothetical protein